MSSAAATVPRPRRRFSMLRTAQRLIEKPWVVRAINPIMGKFNPFLPEYRVDPYPFYARLRREAPVYFSPVLRGYILTRHTDVTTLLEDKRFGAERQHSTLFQRLKPFQNLAPEFTATLLSTLLMVDPPRHTRLRRLVNKAFTPRMVARLQPRIEALVAELLDVPARRGTMDVVEDLAYPLPVIVIAEMLGIDAKDRDLFKRWSDALVGFLDPQAGPGPRKIRQAIDELRAYVGRVAEARRAEPRDDLLSALVAAEDAGDRLTTDELYGTVALLLAAGNLTTTHLIGNGLVALLAHPRELERLRDEPAVAPRAVEELLRYDSPVQSTGRIVLEDFTFRGKRFRKGQNVIMSLGAANRDPEVFAEPDRLDLGRDGVPHLSFSHGPHFCLGAQLARLEAAVALPQLLRRFPRIRLGDGLRWGRYLFLRGPSELPVRV